MKNPELKTNLVGRRIHFLTDAEAQIDVLRQTPTMEKEALAVLTAEMMYPGLKDYRKRFGDQSGEIVAVRTNVGGEFLIYTIAFGGELVELHPAIWRLDPI